MRKGEVRNAVYEILENSERARCEDNYLIYKVVKKLVPTAQGLYFKLALKRLQETGLSFESITRHRRKFLELHPELKPKQTTRIRKEEEKNYEKEYGRHLPRLD